MGKFAVLFTHADKGMDFLGKSTRAARPGGLALLLTLKEEWTRSGRGGCSPLKTLEKV